MKRQCLLRFGILVCVLVASQNSFGQSTTSSSASRTKPDQVIEELLSEVHQLRVAMQRMSINTYRGQIMVERLRAQQDQVVRLTRELDTIRNEMDDMKAGEVNLKGRLDEAEKQQDKGLVSEAQINEVRAGLSEQKRREQALTEREAQRSRELDQERINLEDLNKRLDALEREILLSSPGTESKDKPKR